MFPNGVIKHQAASATGAVYSQPQRRGVIQIEMVGQIPPWALEDWIHARRDVNPPFPPVASRAVQSPSLKPVETLLLAIDSASPHVSFYTPHTTLE